MSKKLWKKAFNDGYRGQVMAKTSGANVHNMIGRLCNLECGIQNALRYKSNGDTEKFARSLIRLKEIIDKIHQMTGVHIYGLPTELKELNL